MADMLLKNVIYIPSTMAPPEAGITTSVIAVRLDERGYQEITTLMTAEELNDDPACTKEVMASALNASMFGWHAPIAKAARQYLATNKT